MAETDQPPPDPGSSMPRVLVDDRQDLPVDVDELTSLARAVLLGEGASDAELSVSFVTDREMTELHERYAGEEGPTDVLSFPLDELDEGGTRILGDVVIAPAAAARNDPEDPGHELRLLLAHGILHLLGHDHGGSAGRDVMWPLQDRYAGTRARGDREARA
jgi:probable rRNA maturation factor